MTSKQGAFPGGEPQPSGTGGRGGMQRTGQIFRGPLELLWEVWETWNRCLKRGLARGLWAWDKIMNLGFSLAQPWAALRFLFLLFYIYWALIRPYFLYPRPLPDLLPFPYMLLPGVGLKQGLVRTVKGMWEWTTYLFRWPVIRYWLVWVGSFVLAWWTAADFLWRLFGVETAPDRRELRWRQSRTVILYRAFAPLYRAGFRVVDGRVEDETSWVYWFGGPGRVQVAVENAVVLERPGRGDVRVLVPREDRAWQPLEGYERIRRIVDLRDQKLQFDIHLRTRDGVPLIFRDVQLVYSIARRPPKRRWTRPYPHAARDIRRLVLEEGGAARDPSGDLPWGGEAELRRWRSVEHITQTMRVAFRGRLRRVISGHTLEEILAFIEPEEAETLRVLWRDLLHEGRKDAFLPGPLASYAPFPRAVEHGVHRFDLTVLLRMSYTDRGLHLHWADMQDWEVAVTSIKRQFLQAWQLSRENSRRVSEAALNQVRQDAYLAFLGAEINRWEQILSADGAVLLDRASSREAVNRVRMWLARILELYDEILDRHIEGEELRSIHRP